MDEPGAVGCLFNAAWWELSGRTGPRSRRGTHDRIVAIERDNHRFSDIRHVKDLGKEFVRDWKVLVNYHQLTGEKIPDTRR